MALRKYSTTFLKATSATDSRQTPAAAASVEVYRQGAKVQSNVPVLTSATLVNVRSTGAVVVNDTLQAGTDTTKRFTVTAVTSATSLTMTANGGSTINLLADERLVVVSAPLPILYNNDSSTGTPIANPATADSQGYIEFYTPDSPFDLIVRLSGMSPEVYEDQESGDIPGLPSTNFYNVLDFTDVASALAEVPAGSTLFFPAGVYTAPTAAGWALDKAVTLLGSGNFSVSDGTRSTIFRPYQPGGGNEKDSTVFTITANNVHIQNCMIANTAQPAATGTGDGIRCGASGVTLSYISLQDVSIFYMGRNGVNVAGEGSANWAAETGFSFYGINQSVFRDVLVSQCRLHGYRLYGTADLNLYGCIGQSNVMSGLYGSSSLVTNFTGCSFNSNCSGSTQTNGTESQVQLRTCHAFSFAALDIEEFQASTSKYALVINNTYGGALTGCSLHNLTAVAGTIGVYLMSGSVGNSFHGIKIDRVATAFQIVASDSNTGNFVGPIAVSTADATCPATIVVPAQASNVASTSGGNFAILPLGDGNETGANFSAALQLPVVEGHAAYTRALTEGIFLYNSAAASGSELMYYNGTAWYKITAVTA